MYLVMIVEDDEPTRRRVADEIAAEISEIEFLLAGSFEDAEKQIQEALADGRDVHAAILDSQLPRGGRLLICMDLCDRVSAKFPSILCSTAPRLLGTQP